MRVYVVLEEDRGCGPSVAGVFASLDAAQEYLDGPDGSNCYLYSEEGEEVDPITHKPVSEVYEIVYWNADHGGMRDLPTDSEIFEGTFEEAEAHVRAKRSLWGHNYIPHVPGPDSNYCGNGVIHRISK